MPLNWTVIECSLGIICVSIPPMRPLLSRLLPNFLPTHLTGTNGRSKSKGSRATRRTQEEILEDMNRELDRQLMEFGRESHADTKPVSAGSMEEGSMVQLTEVRRPAHSHRHNPSGSAGTFDFDLKT